MAQQGSWARYLVWGSIAGVAVISAAVTIALVVGNHRGIQIASPAKPPSPPAQQAPARSAAVPAMPAATQTSQAASNEMPAITVAQAKDLEIARLNDALRTLAAERDRLDERVQKLEQSLGDITASIRDRIGPPASASTPARIEAASEPAPRIEQPKVAPRVAAAPSQPIAPDVIRHGVPPAGTIASIGGGEAFLPYVSGRPMVSPPSATQEPMQIHAIPLTREAAPAPGSIATRTEFALDLGSEPTMDALRTRWNSLRGTQGAVLGKLRPLVSVREGNRPGSVELRLVAGPLGNAGEAARLCAALQPKGVSCQTTVFDGQRLALH